MLSAMAVRLHCAELRMFLRAANHAIPRHLPHRHYLLAIDRVPFFENSKVL